MRSQFLAPLLLLASPVFSAPAPGKDSDCDAVVKPNESIQKAIDNAKRGDRIVVEAGTYAEQLTITKDGIQLIGKGAILVPPTPYKQNFCTGLSKGFPDAQGNPGPDTDAGICIYGKGTELLAYQKEHKRIAKYGDIVKNVVVRGFEVRGFNGENIAVIAGENVKVHDNKLVDGGQYGFLTVGSKDTVARKNVITATLGGFIAMCQDDKANAKFIENNISNYYIALCGQTDGGLMKKNTVKDCCVGPFIDPGKKGIRVIENTVSGRGKGCSVTPDTGAGIIIFGAQDTLVQGNIFENIKNNDTGSPTGSGAFISDDPASGAKARGNVFKNNIFRGNDIDIVVNNGTAGPNTFRGNQCAVGSVPNGLCGN